MIFSIYLKINQYAYRTINFVALYISCRIIVSLYYHKYK